MTRFPVLEGKEFFAGLKKYGFSEERRRGSLNLLPGSLIGGSIGGVTGFFFPRLGEKFIEFIG